MPPFSLSPPLFSLSVHPPFPLPPLLLHPSLVRSLTQLSHSRGIPVGLAFSILRLCRGHGPPTVTVAGTNGRQRKVCVCVCYPLTLFHHHPPPPPPPPPRLVHQFHRAQLPSQSAAAFNRHPRVLAQREAVRVPADVPISSTSAN